MVSYESEFQARFYGFNNVYEKSLNAMKMVHQGVVERTCLQELMLLEYRPVITYTKQHGLSQVISSAEHIKNDGIDLCLADRGGDVTFHGPGQLVGYPVMLTKNLAETNQPDIGGFIRTLERGLLNAAKQLGVVDAEILPGFTGIWVKTRENKKIVFKKLVAIGIGVSHGVSRHGFAFNLSIEHERYAKHIVPCGLKDRGVITLREVLESSGLEMPGYFAMVALIASSIAHEFSLKLNWDSSSSKEGKNGQQHHHAAIG